MSSFGKYVQDSNSPLAKIVRRCVATEDQDKWDRRVDAIGMAIATVCVALVFLAIAVGETFTAGRFY